MKTLDNDIYNLIKQSKNLNHRAVIFMTGENRLKRIGVVCNFIEKLGTKNILYCYVKDNKRKKTEMKDKKKKSMIHMVQTYLQKKCPSEIRWCLYKDTQKILGKTFDICIFQDYEFLTPNIIARGMETVAGGGFVIFLAPELNDLEAHFNTIHNSGNNEIFNSYRFLKRFTVSLIASKFCICLDDNYTLLNKKKKPIKFVESVAKKDNTDLNNLKESLKFSESAFYPLVNICATFDQARCLKNLCSSIKMFNHPSNKDDNDSRYAVTSIVTAARGRGKSAALGLALCAALQTGVTQICVTSPSPENIATLWQYVKLGLKSLDYAEHIDFDMTTSYLSDGVKAVTKVELKKNNYTQVIRYIQPSDTETPDCDLLCIDEAAAIPLTTLQMYLRSFTGLVFISSTVSGYEGSGMALSTQLFAELRQTFTIMTASNEASKLYGNTRGRLYEITLEEPIRYGINDPVESYLYRTMCMNYKAGLNNIINSPLSPDQCHLVHINRDILFDCNKSSESVLQQIMSIYSASNNQNSPDDLISIADNGATRLLCLTDSALTSENPTIIVVLQVSFEGDINVDYIGECLRNNGIRPTVDIVSDLLTEEYLEPRFKKLSGLRIDLIATSPQFVNCGYGSRALSLLIDYLTAQTPCKSSSKRSRSKESLLMPLSSFPKFSFHYVTFYGSLNEKLIKFFRKVTDFMVVYLDSELDEITLECKGVLMKKLNSPDHGVFQFNWLALFTKIYAKRFSLLKYGPFRRLSEDMKVLVDNSSYPDIVKEYCLLPKDDIVEFTINN